MSDVSLVRLYALRAGYVLLVVGLGSEIWPLILHPPANLELMRGVVWSMLSALALVAIIGLRYPLAMLPLLFFEIVWKAIWVGMIGLTAWRKGRMDAAMHDTWFACLMGLVVFPILIPWGYVWRRFVRQAGDRWRARAVPAMRPVAGD